MSGTIRQSKATAAAALLALALALGGATASARAATAPPGHGGNPAAATQTTAGAADHHEPSLLNPINTGLVTSLTTLIVFLALVAILGKYAWGPIASGLAAREQKIRKDIADAEAARARAEATLKEYNAQLATAEGNVRDMMAKAAAEAQQVADRIKVQAGQDAQAIKERTEREIGEAKDRAVAELYEQAAALSTGIAEQILRRNLNPDDQRDLVNRSLDLLKAEAGNGRRIGQG